MKYFKCKLYANNKKKYCIKNLKKLMKTNQSRKDSKSSHFFKKTGEYKSILISELDTSPLNYRKSFPIKELDELAADIKQHGIISNLIVRRSDSERYELVTGERRFRAAKIAGLKEVPVNIVSLSDQEVIEIQLSENLQRSDTHPMDEAFAIERLQSVYHNMDEIAFRMGKTKAFVYRRLKLVSLIDGFRELFLANKCTSQQAYDIASLSMDSQTDFYNESCSDWQTENFEMSDTAYVLDRFRYDLTEAPFDTKDPELIPAVGACNSCQFNSATRNSLFPDQANEAVCSNKVCYNKKCLVNFSWKVNSILVEDKPEALLFQGSPDRFRNLTQLMPEEWDHFQNSIFTIFRLWIGLKCQPEKIMLMKTMIWEMRKDLKRHYKNMKTNWMSMNSSLNPAITGRGS